MKFLSITFLGLILASVAYGEPVSYISEEEFLSDLAVLGLSPVHEGFEDDAAWGGVRSSIVGGNSAASSVSNHGITWTANNLSSQVTTGSGAARTGEWGLYSTPHGSYTRPDPGSNCLNPGECGDGIRARIDSGEFYAAGGWFRTNTPFAELGMFIEQYPDNAIDFGETCDNQGENCSANDVLGTQLQFFGVIDPEGFTQFEFRELEGTAEDAKFIFADDFYLAGSTISSASRSSIWALH
ncbi:MAG: hypothetical protein KC944_16150 [Candidatus Omnitrophica bacterium]|nr:hypothetical protein [Candidatus Omnitrophota bacterium]